MTDDEPLGTADDPLGIGPEVRFTTLRTQLKLATVGTHISPDEQQILGQWFDLFEDALTSDPERFDVGVTATADLTEVAWRVAGPSEAMLAPLLDACDFVGASPAGRVRLEAVGLAIAPGRIGMTLQVGAAGIDAAWFVPEGVEREEVLAIGPPAPLATAIEGRELDVVALEGGLGAAYVGMTSAIQATGESAALRLASVFESNGIAPPPAPLLVALTELHDGALLRNDWFDDGGRVKLSVLADEPSIPTVLAVSAAGNGVDDEVLADFLATLGVLTPRAVEIEQWSTGTKTRLSIEVRSPV